MKTCLKNFKDQQKEKPHHLAQDLLLKNDGTVVTNNHVIANADDIIVRVNNKEYDAKVLEQTRTQMLRYLKIQSTETFETVEFGNSDKSRVGDWVVAIGNPFGLGGTVTSGNNICKK